MSFQIFHWCLSQIPNPTSPQRDVCYTILSRQNPKVGYLYGRQMNQCPYVFLSGELSPFPGLVLNRQSTLYSCNVRNWLWQVQESVQRRARALFRAQQKPRTHYYAQQHFSTFPPPGTALVPQRNTALIPGQSRQTPKSDANNLPQIANLIQVFTISLKAFSQAGSSPKKVYLGILVNIFYSTIKAKNLDWIKIVQNCLRSEK